MDSLEVQQLVKDFVDRRDQHKRQLATDQLLNAISLVMNQRMSRDDPDLEKFVLRNLNEENV
jgi:hypothetical protein